MMHRRPLAALLLILLGILVLTACGDDDETTVDDRPDEETTTTEEDQEEESGSDAESVSVFDLEEGMCIESLGDEEGTVQELPVIDCDAPHEAEVFGVFDLEGGDDAAFPGSTEVESEAGSECEARFEDYVGTSFQESRFQATYLAPNEETWDQGDREVVCVAFADEGDLTESIEGSGE